MLAIGSFNQPLASNQNQFAQQVQNFERLSEVFKDPLFIEMAPSYNLVAAGSEVPFTITNEMPFEMQLDVNLSTSGQAVRVSNGVQEISIPAESSVQLSGEIVAITSGRVDFIVQVNNQDGVNLTTSKSFLSANPDWENWVTLSAVVAMLVLVTIGVFRARKQKSDARAPAQLEPEDPHLFEGSSKDDLS